MFYLNVVIVRKNIYFCFMNFLSNKAAAEEEEELLENVRFVILILILVNIAVMAA